MARHVWRAADAGVMLWEPAAEATTTIVPHEPYEQKQLLPVTEADIQGKWSPAVFPCYAAEQVLMTLKHPWRTTTATSKTWCFLPSKISLGPISRASLWMIT
jgi:hypothetical protein